MAKTLIIGMGAFGFALAHTLSRTHPEREFFAYEKDATIVERLRATREHPYFFPGVQLAPTIHLIDDITRGVAEAEIILIIVPVPFIADLIASLASFVRPGTLFVNCSKGIQNASLRTVSDTLSVYLDGVPYSYAVFSGGMIASELIDGTPLGVTIGVSDRRDVDILQDLFVSPTLAVDVTTEYRDIELFGSLKNILALYAGCLEGRGYGLSSIGRSLVELYRELPLFIELLGGSGKVDFGSFALGGDLIATCFGASRNRSLGQLVGSGISPIDAVEILRSEKKHAEGYETLRGLLPLIRANDLPHFQEVASIFFPREKA